MELMLAERILLEAICRIMEIKQHQLYRYMDELYQEVPDDLACSVPEDTEIEFVRHDCETDELWSFVGHKVFRYGSSINADITSLLPSSNLVAASGRDRHSAALAQECYAPLLHSGRAMLEAG